MDNILYLEKHREKAKPSSLLDMIINPHKRHETYRFYDENYEETQEEKEIFEAWKKKRTQRND